MSGGPASKGSTRVLQRPVGRQAPGPVDVDPERLFGPFGSLEGPIDRLFLLSSREQPETVAEPIQGDEVVRRMVHSVQYEFERFRSYYLMFRFAFPGASNPHFETIGEQMDGLLRRGLAAKPSMSFIIPIPCRSRSSST